MDPRIEEILIDWELAHSEGKMTSLEELCQNHPELLEEVKKHLR